MAHFNFWVHGLTCRIKMVLDYGFLQHFVGATSLMVFYHQMVGMPYPNVAILAWDVSQSQALLMLRPACRALAAAAKARFWALKNPQQILGGTRTPRKM